MVREQKAV